MKYEAISVPQSSVRLVKKTQDRKSSTCYLLIPKGVTSSSPVPLKTCRAQSAGNACDIVRSCQTRLRYLGSTFKETFVSWMPPNGTAVSAAMYWTPLHELEKNIKNYYRYMLSSGVIILYYNAHPFAAENWFRQPTTELLHSGYPLCHEPLGHLSKPAR
ncbi:hypothetical protein TNCV_1577611 [Trichonephila clavipes]|nr:hypothetical protein TNCV_1577611 [Trichonephila clavipes]